MNIFIFVLCVVTLILLICNGWLWLLVSKRLEDHAKRLKSLEDGAVPDHEKAKAAAKATNDFMTGVASIMGFDPYETIRKGRQQEGGYGE